MRDCTGVNVHYGCDRVVRAELHMYWSAQGVAGTPIWTFQFGQDVNGRTITRQVDAVTGRVVMVEETKPRGAGHPQIVAPVSSLSIRVQLSEQENAPSVDAVRHGQQFWTSLTARINTRIMDPVVCLVFVLRSTGHELKRGCQDSNVSVEGSGGTLAFRTEARLRLGATENADVLDITGLVTASGVTQQGHASVRVYR